jgi:hypothetical protein
MKRIIAFVTTQNQEVTVEVVNIFTTGDGRQIATVEALPIDGKEIRPFTQYTHGGPCQSSDARISIAALKNIAIAVELPVTLAVEVGSL